MACLCCQASKIHSSPMVMKGTLRKKPTHIAPVKVTDAANIKEGEKITVAGETIDSEDLQSLDGQHWVMTRYTNQNIRDFFNPLCKAIGIKLCELLA